MLGLLAGASASPLHAQVTITQNKSSAVVAFNSISCVSGGLTRDVSYFRTFTLADHGIAGAFAISSIEIGIEVAQAGVGQGGVMPLEINIYGNSTGVPGTFAGFGSPLFSQTFSLADQRLTLQSFLTPALVTTPGFTLQVRSPDLQPTGGRFFIGTNADGQTAPSYISSGACNVSQPTDLASLGFPNRHAVMNVTGTPVSTVPEPSTYVLMLAGLAGVTVVARRRRTRAE